MIEVVKEATPELLAEVIEEQIRLKGQSYKTLHSVHIEFEITNELWVAFVIFA